MPPKRSLRILAAEGRFSRGQLTNMDATLNRGFISGRNSRPSVIESRTSKQRALLFAQLFREVEEEFIVEHHVRSLFHKTVPVRHTATVRYIAPFDVQPHGGIVARMQSYHDSHNAGTQRNF